MARRRNPCAHPIADTSLYKIPDGVDDEVSVILSDILQMGKFRSCCPVSLANRAAAEDGQLLIIDPNWPGALRGEAARNLPALERDKAHGFRLAVQVLQSPGGTPGDIGLFLVGRE